MAALRILASELVHGRRVSSGQKGTLQPGWQDKNQQLAAPNMAAFVSELAVIRPPVIFTAPELRVNRAVSLVKTITCNISSPCARVGMVIAMTKPAFTQQPPTLTEVNTSGKVKSTVCVESVTLIQAPGSVFAAVSGVQPRVNRHRAFTRDMPPQFISTGVLCVGALLVSITR